MLAQERKVLAALKEIDALPSIAGKSQMIRFLK